MDSHWVLHHLQHGMWEGGLAGGATSHHAHPQQDADVLGCSVQQDTLMVRAVDTHNIVGDRQNDLDSSGQDQVWECVVEVT